MGTFRTRKTYEAYRAYGASLPPNHDCALCGREDQIVEFTHWRIIKNRFPYDGIAKTHDMILPKRHCLEHEVTPEEWKEFNELKHGYCDEHYEFLIEPMDTVKSIPKHFHLHLITAKDFNA